MTESANGHMIVRGQSATLVSCARPVIAGVATDKLLVLHGEPQLTIRHEQLHAHVTSDDILAFALARKAKRLEEKQTETSALASSGNA
jgi:hypothetical protein